MEKVKKYTMKFLMPHIIENASNNNKSFKDKLTIFSWDVPPIELQVYCGHWCRVSNILCYVGELEQLIRCVIWVHEGHRLSYRYTYIYLR